MTYSELDDLKSAWQTLNRNLERQHALTLHQFREKKLNRFRAGFRPLVIGQIIQIICGALLALCGGSFWVDHLGVAHLMIYGISVHLYGIMLIVFAARDLFLIKQFDYAAPVLVLQKQIADLRAWHLHAGLWFGITGCFIWIPLLLMTFYGLGADVWRRNPEVVGWFFLSSVGVLARHPPLRDYRLVAPAWQGKIRQESRRQLRRPQCERAQSLLDEIAQFERE